MNKLKVTKDLEQLIDFKKADPSMADSNNVKWLAELHKMIISWDCDETYEALSQACTYDIGTAVWIMTEVETAVAHLSHLYPSSDPRLNELRNSLKEYPSLRFSPYPYFEIPKELWQDFVSEFVQLAKEHSKNKVPLKSDNPDLISLKSRELQVRNHAISLGYLKLQPGY